MNKFKQVPQLDDDGYFTGMSIADENPMRPGSYMLGQGAIDVEPPFRPPAINEAIRWDADKQKWKYEPDYTTIVLFNTESGRQINPQTVKRGMSLTEMSATILKPEPGQNWDATRKCWTYTLEFLKAQKIVELSGLNQQKQSAGITIDGVLFDSSHQAHQYIIYITESAEKSGSDTTAFKAKSGIVDLTVEQLKKATAVIFEHLQTCIKVERDHALNIQVIDRKEDVQKYDFATGWPV